MNILSLVSFFFVLGISFAQRGCGPNYCHPSCCAPCRHGEICTPTRIPIRGLNPCTCEYRRPSGPPVVQSNGYPMLQPHRMDRWRIRPRNERRFTDPVGRSTRRGGVIPGVDPRMDPILSVLGRDRHLERRQNVEPLRSDIPRPKETKSMGQDGEIIYGEAVPIYNFMSKHEKGTDKLIPLDSFLKAKDSKRPDQVVRDPSVDFGSVSGSFPRPDERSSVSFLPTRREPLRELQGNTQSGIGSIFDPKISHAVDNMPLPRSSRPNEIVRGSDSFPSNGFPRSSTPVGPNIIHPEKPSERSLRELERLPSLPDRARGGIFSRDMLIGGIRQPDFPRGLGRLPIRSIIPPRGLGHLPDRSMIPPRGLGPLPDRSMIPPRGRSQSPGRSMIPPRGMGQSPDRSMIPQRGLVALPDRSMIPPLDRGFGKNPTSDQFSGLPSPSKKHTGSVPDKDKAPSYVTKDVFYHPERYHDVNNIPYYDNQPYDYSPYRPETRDPVTHQDIMRMISEGRGRHTNGLFDPRTQREVPRTTQDQGQGHHSVADGITQQSPLVHMASTAGDLNKRAAFGQLLPMSDFKKETERTASVNSINDFNINPSFPVMPVGQSSPISDSTKEKGQTADSNSINNFNMNPPFPVMPVGQSSPISDSKREKGNTADVNSINEFNMNPPFPFMPPMHPMPPFPGQPPPQAKKSF